jgi:hypothetical protein
MGFVPNKGSHNYDPDHHNQSWIGTPDELGITSQDAAGNNRWHRGYTPERLHEVSGALGHIDWGDTHPADRAAFIQHVARSTAHVGGFEKIRSINVGVPDKNRDPVRGKSNGSWDLRKGHLQVNGSLARNLRENSDTPEGREAAVEVERTALHEIGHVNDPKFAGSKNTPENKGRVEAFADKSSEETFVPHRKDADVTIPENRNAYEKLSAISRERLNSVIAKPTDPIGAGKEALKVYEDPEMSFNDKTSRLGTLYADDQQSMNWSKRVLKGKDEHIQRADLASFITSYNAHRGRGTLEQHGQLRFDIPGDGDGK